MIINAIPALIRTGAPEIDIFDLSIGGENLGAGLADELQVDAVPVGFIIFFISAPGREWTGTQAVRVFQCG